MVATNCSVTDHIIQGLRHSWQFRSAGSKHPSFSKTTTIRISAILFWFVEAQKGSTSSRVASIWDDRPSQITLSSWSPSDISLIDPKHTDSFAHLPLLLRYHVSLIWTWQQTNTQKFVSSSPIRFQSASEIHTNRDRTLRTFACRLLPSEFGSTVLVYHNDVSKHKAKFPRELRASKTQYLWLSFEFTYSTSAAPRLQVIAEHSGIVVKA